MIQPYIHRIRPIVSHTVVPLMLFLWIAAAPAETLPFIHAQGSRLVNTVGEPVILKGCNLGNWLMLEPWMFGGCLPAKDQSQIFSNLTTRFGTAQRDHLLDVYRSSYITQRDFDLIRSFGFNVVRLPFHYSVLQEDQPPYNLKPNGFAYLDKALVMAETAGIYVILDFHGAPGGQSTDMPTGQVNQNHLWTDTTDQARTIAIWRAVAERYHDRSVVAAYDLLNEPYGNFHQNLKPDLAKLMSSLYTAIRQVDDRHVMFASGGLNTGIAFYGNPHDRGWHDFGFTEHFYPGLFGSKPVVESHARTLSQVWPGRKAYLYRIESPYFVGEFNVVLSAAGGNPMMREYFDRLANNGWAGTMWSYKLLSAGGHSDDHDVWHLVTNSDPLPKLNLQTSSYQDFEKFFSSMATIPLSVNEPLRDALTTPTPSPLPLAHFAAPPTTLPSSSETLPAGWSADEIGDAAHGTTSTDSHGVMMIYAGGSDIFSTHDSFRFVFQPAQEPSELSARVLSLLDSNTYAKAGVMARWGNTADAPFAMVNINPAGQVALCSRPSKAASAVETRVEIGTTTNVDIRLKIEAGRATGFFRQGQGDWTLIGTAPVPTEHSFNQGYAVCAHQEPGFTIARFAPAGQADAKPSSVAVALPDNWKSWGSWKRAQDANYSTDSGSPAGLWQDVPVEPGKRYRFAVSATDESKAQSHHVELRLENTLDNHQLLLNSATFPVSTVLTLTGTSMDNHMRVLVVCPGPGKITIHNASLTDVTSETE
jgi:endoglucanase